MSGNTSSRKQKKKEKKQQQALLIKEQNKSELEKEAQVKESENAIFDEHLNAIDTEAKEPEAETIKKIHKEKKEKNKEKNAEKSVHQGTHFHLTKVFENRKVRIATVTVLFLLVIVITVLSCIIADKSADIEEYERMVSVLNDSLNTSKQNISDLQKQIDEINETNKAMSETVSAVTDELNLYKEEVRRSKIPSAYPIKGTSSIMNMGMDEDGNAVTVDAEEGQEEEKDPEVLFSVTVDTSVIAAGTGTVKNVDVDEKYGIIIEIEHDNGYTSVYRGAGVALVAPGDVISQGSVIMKIAAEESVFSYQIMYENDYIDPMTCMEING